MDRLGTVVSVLVTTLLSSCRSSLADGKFRWLNDQILAQFATGMEQARKKPRQHSKAHRYIHFLRAGKAGVVETRSRGILTTVSDWEMRVALKKQLKFPEKITTTCLRPDIVLWSGSTQQVMFMELTVPWEERIEEAQNSAPGASQGTHSGEVLGCWE